MARTISLSLPEDLSEWLEEEAKRRNMKIQDVIREALQKYRTIVESKIDKLLEAYEDITKAIQKLEEALKK